MRPEFVLAGGIRRLVLALACGALVGIAACGGGGAREAEGPAGPAVKSGASASDRGDAGVAADAAPAARPFAGSPAEAAQLIGTAIDKNGADVRKCVAEYRTRKKLPHERVEISVGIDQEGRLLGATLKGGKQDQVFSDCVQRALATSPFPRSRAGVIQVTKSYEEIEQ